MKRITIEEELQIPGTDVILEEGDRIKVLKEAYLPLVSKNTTDDFTRVLAFINSVAGDYDVREDTQEKLGFEMGRVMNIRLADGIMKGLKKFCAHNS